MSLASPTAIIDAASSLFARHGFARTSVQAVAEASGYSKAGLLHHYPTKMALYTAAIDECEAQISAVHDRVAALPVGCDRDERTVELLVDLSLARPGLASLLLSTILPNGDEEAPELDRLADILFSAFGSEGDSDSRRLRVTGALVALGVLSLEARRCDRASQWRNEIIGTSIDALGQRQ